MKRKTNKSDAELKRMLDWKDLDNHAIWRRSRKTNRITFLLRDIWNGNNYFTLMTVHKFCKKFKMTEDEMWDSGRLCHDLKSYIKMRNRYRDDYNVHRISK